MSWSYLTFWRAYKLLSGTSVVHSAHHVPNKTCIMALTYVLKTAVFCFLLMIEFSIWVIWKLLTIGNSCRVWLILMVSCLILLFCFYKSTMHWLDLHNVTDVCGFVLCRLCVIAGNISPIDVITHLPILCEEANVPYIYVNSKEVGYIFLSTIYVHCVEFIVSPYNLETLKFWLVADSFYDD
jgi:hypothetical protein